ncbi:MAG: glycerophosphodiester phosphodiesterase [Peptococcaceae bacterium]
MLVIAHRGAGAYSPHNSRQAFAQAIALGAEMIETDIRVTSDNVPVIHHDPNIYETPIDHLTWPEIKNYSLANGEFLPSLAEILQLFGSRIPFNFEIKPLPLDKLEPIAAVIKNYDLYDPIISSFSQEIVRNLPNLLNLQTALLIDKSFPVKTLTAALADLQTSIANIYYPLLNPCLVRELHGNNYKVIVWTDFLSEIWNPFKLYAGAYHLNCHGFITGKPDLLVRYLKFAGDKF